jgi:GTPase SAR1 family protein
MKSDLRDQFAQNYDEYRGKGWEAVPASQGEEMAKAVAARAYVECSSKIQYNVKKVFETAIKAVLHPPSAVPVKDSGGGGGCCDVA